MMLLDKKNYYKVSIPLRNVPINNLFARAVIETKVVGTVYVDNVEMPSTFYVIHPYGMSLLFGKTDNNKFNTAFVDYAFNCNHVRIKPEWMQTFPRTWDDVFKKLFSDSLVASTQNQDSKLTNIIELSTRVNFKFNRENYVRQKQERLPENILVMRTDAEMFTGMKGTVIPSLFWNNAAEFCKSSIGFSLLYDNKLASMSFAAFIHDDKLEIGIETVGEFRGKGFATFVCTALIDYCLENGYEPVWACRLENSNSYRLAEKLGFEETLRLPYYRLCF